MSVFPSSVSAPAASPAVASAAPNIPSRLRRPRTMMKTAMLINLVLIAASPLPSALAAPFYPTATYPIVLKKLTVDRTASRLSGTIWVYEIPGGSYTSYAYIKILDSKKEVITGSGGQATRTTPQVTDNVFAYTFSGVDPLSLDNYADTVLTTSTGVFGQYTTDNNNTESNILNNPAGPAYALVNFDTTVLGGTSSSSSPISSQPTSSSPSSSDPQQSPSTSSTSPADGGSPSTSNTTVIAAVASILSILIIALAIFGGVLLRRRWKKSQGVEDKSVPAWKRQSSLSVGSTGGNRLLASRASDHNAPENVDTERGRRESRRKPSKADNVLALQEVRSPMPGNAPASPASKGSDFLVAKTTPSRPSQEQRRDGSSGAKGNLPATPKEETSPSRRSTDNARSNRSAPPRISTDSGKKGGAAVAGASERPAARKDAPSSPTSSVSSKSSTSTTSTTSSTSSSPLSPSSPRRSSSSPSPTPESPNSPTGRSDSPTRSSSPTRGSKGGVNYRSSKDHSPARPSGLRQDISAILTSPTPAATIPRRSSPTPGQLTTAASSTGSTAPLLAGQSSWSSSSSNSSNGGTTPYSPVMPPYAPGYPGYSPYMGDPLQQQQQQAAAAAAAATAYYMYYAQSADPAAAAAAAQSAGLAPGGGAGATPAAQQKSSKGSSQGSAGGTSSAAEVDAAANAAAMAAYYAVANSNAAAAYGYGYQYPYVYQQQPVGYPQQQQQPSPLAQVPVPPPVSPSKSKPGEERRQLRPSQRQQEQQKRQQDSKRK